MASTTPLPYHASTVWVVVADHDHARTFLRQPRDMVVSQNAHDLKEILAWGLKELPDFDLKRERDNSLPLDVADRLNQAHAEGRFDGVIIVAPPAWLGHMRQHLTRQLKDAVILEVAKDLANLPQTKLLERLADLMPSRDGALE